ncbi:Threonine dehydratase, partial [Pseudomonas syringae pv. primulae]
MFRSRTSRDVGNQALTSLPRPPYPRPHEPHPAKPRPDYYYRHSSHGGLADVCSRRLQKTRPGGGFFSASRATECSTGVRHDHYPSLYRPHCNRALDRCLFLQRLLRNNDLQGHDAMSHGQPDLLNHYARKILTSRVYDVAIETPLHGARQLSERLGNQVLLKREDLQPVFSFKIRGAYNKLAQLTAEDAARGVVTASAGNHAQGLALAARELGIKATIVMPRTTPEIKVEGVRSRGATVVLHGDSFPEALAYSLKLVDEQGFVYIHPYDDPDTIAGQGTVAMEILRQQPGQLDAIFVPVGGGGLIAGIAAYVKYLRPEIKVIGVEPDDSNCLQAAMAAGERVVLSQVGLFADGVAVAQIGHHTFEVCRHYVDEVITVSTDEICAAIKDIYDDTRSITEPSGALAVAGIKKYV